MVALDTMSLRSGLIRSSSEMRLVSMSVSATIVHTAQSGHSAESLDLPASLPYLYPWPRIEALATA